MLKELKKMSKKERKAQLDEYGLTEAEVKTDEKGEYIIGIDPLGTQSKIYLQLKVEEEVPEGLNQSFVGLDGVQYVLKEFLTRQDWWTLKKHKVLLAIITHDGVKKIANRAGMGTNPKYTVLIQPSDHNNYTTAMQVEICDSFGKCTTDIGESSRSNLGTHGRQNPINMAQKRAYDRAVFRHLGITGLLAEDELQDEEEPNEMDKLSFDEQKEIVPLLNLILGAKGKQDLTAFKNKMKGIKGLKEEQLNLLRGMWKKKFAEFAKTF